VVEFRFLEIDVEVTCGTGCEQIRDLLAFCYSEFDTRSSASFPLSVSDARLRYRVGRNAEASKRARQEQPSYFLELPTGEICFAEDEGELLFLFEKDVTTRSQRIRSDLLFLHASALGWRGRGALLVGDPGSGKSTLTFALLEGGGFDYLSDELAPVELETLCVHPYPRALWLKNPPPLPWQLPSAVRQSSRGIHGPSTALGAKLAEKPLPLGALFLLEPGVATRREPSLERISAGEATARLFANLLNPRGHPADALDAALAVVTAAPCFSLRPAGLEATRALVLAALD
jgi:hypothetical protein